MNNKYLNLIKSRDQNIDELVILVKENDWIIDYKWKKNKITAYLEVIKENRVLQPFMWLIQNNNLVMGAKS